MTREQCKKLLADGRLQGWAGGEILQVRCFDQKWRDWTKSDGSPSDELPTLIADASNIRLKPKPREWWVPEWDDMEVKGGPFQGLPRPTQSYGSVYDPSSRPPDRWIKVREVVEGT